MTGRRLFIATVGVALPAVFAIALAGSLWRAATGETTGPVAAIGEWSPEPPADVGAPAAAKSVTHPETLARPLFMRTRKPFEPPPSEPPAIPQQVFQSPPAAAPAVPQLDSDIRVAGVVTVGPMRRALLVSPSAPQGEWYGEGASFGGWTLAEVQRDAVLLKGGGQQMRLELYPAR